MAIRFKRQIEITVEVERRWVIHGAAGSVAAFCAACNRVSSLLTVDQAAAFSGVTSRTIYRWVEGEKLHSAETAEGWLRICFHSLSQQNSK